MIIANTRAITIDGENMQDPSINLIDSSKFNYNAAKGSGGAIFSIGSNLLIINS